MVKMRRITGQNVTAQHGQPNCWACTLLRQIRNICGDMVAGQVWMIKAHFGVFDRRRGRNTAPFRPGCVARNQKAHEAFNIIVRSTEPILHGQEPRPQILTLTRNKVQNFGNPPQHLCLAFAGAARFLRRLQLLQEPHHARGGPHHVQLTHFGQLHNFLIGDYTHQSITGRTPRF